jgi:hypothetical protein
MSLYIFRDSYTGNRENFIFSLELNIMTYMTIARQRLLKSIPEVKVLTIEGHPVAVQRTNKHAAITIRDKNERCFP